MEKERAGVKAATPAPCNFFNGKFVIAWREAENKPLLWVNAPQCCNPQSSSKNTTAALPLPVRGPLFLVLTHMRKKEESERSFLMPLKPKQE